MATTVQPTIQQLRDPALAPRVAHHFQSAQQQFDAGKLGMWLFLVTEVLFFSGLFVAYAVYRGSHPEVFVDAHKYLNTTLGTINTIVLLLSSLTMAWAVRCAQLGQSRGLFLLLAASLACAALFLGVKAVEYSHKWGEGLLWAGAYAHQVTSHAESAGHFEVESRAASSKHIHQAMAFLSLPAALGVLVSVVGVGVAWKRKRRSPQLLWTALLVSFAAFFLGLGTGEAVEKFAAPSHPSSSAIVAGDSQADATPAPKSLTGVFFSIYYAMTGVHAIHILAGMGVMVWLLQRTLRGDFGPAYFGPIDYAGLYWHLVDLVWIYLFPLLYLIR